MRLSLLAIFALAACHPSPGAASPDADASVSCAAACLNLAAMQCPEGDNGCTNNCLHAEVGGMFDLHPACLAAAKTPANARACSNDGGSPILCKGR